MWGWIYNAIHKQRNKQRNKEIISHSINPVQCFRSFIESKNVVFLSLGNIKLVFQRSGRQAVNPNPPAPPLSEDLCGTRPAFGELLSPWALFSGVGESLISLEDSRFRQRRVGFSSLGTA